MIHEYFYSDKLPKQEKRTEREASLVSRNRYIGDYHLADTVDDRGKIRTDVEYTGGLYSFSKDAETIRRTKNKSLLLCVAGWLAYIVAMIPISVAMKTFYSAIPFVFIAVPMALLTGTAAEVFPLKERFIHKHADRIENRWPASSAFIAILSGIALTGEAVTMIRGQAMTSGDLVFVLCAPVLLLTGILAWRAGKDLKCEKLP